LLGSQFCKNTIGLVLLTRFIYIILGLASVVGARMAPSETRTKIGFKRQFRDKTRPSKHRFRPLGISDVPFTSETERRCANLCLINIRKYTYSLSVYLRAFIRVLKLQLNRILSVWLLAIVLCAAIQKSKCLRPVPAHFLVFKYFQMSSVVDLASEEPAPKVQSKDPFPKSAALAMMGARNSAASKTKTPVKSRAKAGTGKAKTPVNKATGSAQKKTKTVAAAKSSGIASVEDTVGSIGDIEDIAKRFLKGGT